MVYKRFLLGQQVKWVSQSSGTVKSKNGTIVGVIPPHMTLRQWNIDQVTNEETLELDEYNIEAIKWSYQDTWAPPMRNHESYLVEVLSEGSGKKQLYWPLVSKLELAT